MVENLPITVLSESEAADSCGGDAAIIGLELDILSEPACFHIGITKKEARLADIVPLVRTISAKITGTVVERIRREGGCIPCRRGCSACCSFLVPMSIPEAFRLREEMLAVSKSYWRRMQRLSLSAAQCILKQKPPKSFMCQTTGASAGSSVEPKVVSNWYANLKLACPFHYKGVCTIYEQRPLACREYLVKGSAEVCRSGRGAVEVVEVPMRMADVLSQLASELEGTDAEAVMAPLALVWCEENTERDKQTWPAVMMVERFVKIVKTIEQKISTAVIAPA